jgi:octaheme c-type cytochrome (tetrathionate reductase family)
MKIWEAVNLCIKRILLICGITHAIWKVRFNRERRMHMSKYKRSIGLLIGLLVIALGTIGLFGSPLFVEQAMADDDPPPDHSLFPQLQVEFATGPEVTTACLECHANEASEVMMTTHWTWEYETEDGQTVGKNNVINNYCVAVDSNWPRCTSCHVGYGYTNPEAFAEMGESQVDCLVCHDTTGTYKKFPAGAGHPTYEEKIFPAGPGEPYGKPWIPPDLAAIAQAVGTPSRANCGSCHFNGGGGPNVKHGDLDTTMVNPTIAIDVHMDAEGLNFTCQTCHTTEDHKVAGSRYDWDVHGETNLKTCNTCHTDAPHGDETMDAHTARVSCQTCHIPVYAKEAYTKTFWDWSTAGELKDGEGEFEGRKVWIVKKDDASNKVYMSPKGTFEWGVGLTPDYTWYNGDATWITLDDELTAEGYTPINMLHGDVNDENALIFPMKSFYAVQPADAGTNKLAVPNLFPTNPETAYWKNWDWDLALTGGQAVAGYEYSGELGWVETVMYWPLTHQVSPASEALQCTDCHAAEGVLDFEALGYEAERAALLMTFPPVEPTPEPTPEPTEEPTEVPPTEVPPTEVPEPTEAPVEDEAVAPEEAAPEEAIAEKDSGGLPTWVIIVGVVAIVAVFAFFIIKGNQK